MKTDLICEICDSCDWLSLGKRQYKYEQINTCIPSASLRLRVLFDKWFYPAKQVEVEYFMCRKCGFIMSNPRPEGADIEIACKYLEQLGHTFSSPASLPDVSKKRSCELYEAVGRYVDLDQVSSVLDFGGGDGSLMRSFWSAGKSCFLVDYSASAHDTVVKIGDTIHDIEGDPRFDLIVCSHVLEHVADPLEVVRLLGDKLSSTGKIYIEVPFQLWKKVPGEYEPVVHINFYTENSLYNLMVLAGFAVDYVGLGFALSVSGYSYHVVRLVASSNAFANKEQNLRKPDVINWLRPGLIAYTRYYSFCPSEIFRWFIVKFKALICLKR